MTKSARMLLILPFLAACSLSPQASREDAPEIVVQTPDDSVLRPVLRPDPGGAEGTAGVEGTSAPAAVGRLGTTIASLGNPAEPGLWLKTPLVAQDRSGKVGFGGKTVAVSLIAIEGQAGAGSRMSLSAMQALGIPLTDLAEVSVSAD